MARFSTSFRRLLPALALLSSLALTSCWEKKDDPKPNTQRCGNGAPAPAPGGGNS